MSIQSVELFLVKHQHASWNHDMWWNPNTLVLLRINKTKRWCLFLTCYHNCSVKGASLASHLQELNYWGLLKSRQMFPWREFKMYYFLAFHHVCVSQEKADTQNSADWEVYIDGLLHSYIMLWIQIIALYEWSYATHTVLSLFTWWFQPLLIFLAICACSS